MSLKLFSYNFIKKNYTLALFHFTADFRSKINRVSCISIVPYTLATFILYLLFRYNEFTIELMNIFRMHPPRQLKFK